MNRYVELIGLLHSGIECHATGPSYSDIVWKNQTIPKAALDGQLNSLNQHRLDASANTFFMNSKPMNALIKWIAPLVNKTEEEALDEIKRIFKAL